MSIDIYNGPANGTLSPFILLDRELADIKDNIINLEGLIQRWTHEITEHGHKGGKVVEDMKEQLVEFRTNLELAKKALGVKEIEMEEMRKVGEGKKVEEEGRKVEEVDKMEEVDKAEEMEKAEEMKKVENVKKI